MTYAPRCGVVFIEAPGDRGAWKKFQPDFRSHKAVRPERWPPKQGIPPHPDRRVLQRRVEELHRAVRPQVEALLAAGRDFRAAL
jgi:hypothetical protein